MRYVSINTVPNGSTGTVMRQIAEERRAMGDECWLMWGRGRAAEGDREYNYGSAAGVYADAMATRLDGRAGFHSRAATRRLLAKLDEVRPDVVHLHNLHGYHVNVGMLFAWLAEHEEVQVRWTLHDCWAFTGHCAHFTYAKCAQWKDRCAYSGKCPQLKSYPKTFAGSASCRRSFEDKHWAFTSLPADRMTIVTPSRWLEGLVRQSFLAKYPVEVRHNTIDTSVFKPTPSDFRERYGIGDRFMVLGVASPWTERKGLSDFLRLFQELDPDEYAVVLVGLDKRQIKALPEGVIGLRRTDSPQELAAIYTTADVFFNPTREDNYPTVNLEAEACGTPVVTYDTGGCRETVRMEASSVTHGYDEAMSRIVSWLENVDGHRRLIER